MFMKPHFLSAPFKGFIVFARIAVLDAIHLMQHFQCCTFDLTCVCVFCTCFLIAMQVVGLCQVILDSQLLLGVVVPWQICVKSKHVSIDLLNLANHLVVTCSDLFVFITECVPLRVPVHGAVVPPPSVPEVLAGDEARTHKETKKQRNKETHTHTCTQKILSLCILSNLPSLA